MEYAFGDYDPVAASFTERFRSPLPRAFWLALGRLPDNRPALQAGRRYQNPSGCWMVAEAPAGTAWNAPLELGPEGYGGAGTFIIYDGKPLLIYLSYTHGLVLRFATDEEGAGWTLPALIAPDASLSMRPQAVLLNGAPLIVYYDGQTKELLAAYVGP